MPRSLGVPFGPEQRDDPIARHTTGSGDGEVGEQRETPALRRCTTYRLPVSLEREATERDQLQHPPIG